MIYLGKEDVEEWVLENYEGRVDEGGGMGKEGGGREGLFNERGDGKGKKK